MKYTELWKRIGRKDKENNNAIKTIVKMNNHMEQNIQILRKKINSLLTVDHILINVVGDSSVEQSQGKIRCYCPIHGEKLFRTLTIDIEDKSFRCSYTMCGGYRGGDLLTLFCMATNTPLGEAIKYWANQLGLEEPEISGDGKKEAPKPAISFAQKASRTSIIPYDVVKTLGIVPLKVSVLEYIQREIDRTIRYKRALGLVFLEIDASFFEQKGIEQDIRDQFATCIIESIVHTIRVADAWAHYDADQYLVLLPETDHQNAENVARKLKNAIIKYFKSHPKECPIPLDEISERIHCGVAGISTSKQNANMTAVTLVQHAQQFLNRKEVYKSLETAES